MKIMHIFYTNKKYIRGEESDYLNNGIEAGYTFFKGYSKHNRPKMNLQNIIDEVKKSTYNGIKYEAIQLYTDKFIHTEGSPVYVKDKFIEL